MALPTVYPTGFAGDYTDFLKTKADRSGAVRRTQGTVTIPDASSSDTLIGLMPFNAGFSFAGLGGYNLHLADLDTATNVTVDWGVAYQSTSEGTDNLDLITSASTAAQAGGFVAPDEIDYLNYVSTGNGWVTLRLRAATTEAGAATFNIPFVYDQPELIA